MKHQIIRCLGVVCILLSTTTFAQSVGIGTEAPSANAILELVAPDANQGLLVPRLTTAERTASTFLNNLSVSDNGLLVYDSNEEQFYFWINDQWVAIASGNVDALPNQTGQSNKFLTTDGTNAQWTDIDFNSIINIPLGLEDGDNDTQLTDTDITSLGFIKSADDADADPVNELQDLSLSGNTLSLTNSTIGVDLSPFSGTNTDNQTLSLTGTDLSISGGNTLDISTINTNLSEAEVDAFANNNGYLNSEVDGSITNEIQDISTTGAAGNITLSSGSTLNLNVNDADADDTNEFQTVSKSGNTVTLSDGGGSFSVADNDNSTSNEIQEISTDGTAGDISLSSGSSLTLNVNDADASITNEIQDISTTGAAGNISLSSGSTLNLNVDDGDADDTNEFQDLSLAGSTLSLSNSAATIDLSPFSGTNTDNQTLSLSGTDLSITGGNTLDIGSIDTKLTETEVDAFANNNGYLTSEVDGSTTNEIQDLRFNAGIISLTGDPTTTNIDLSDYDTDASDDFSGNYNDLTNRPTIPTVPTNLSGFTNDVGFITNPNDADASTTNEIQDLRFNAGIISLTGDPTTTNIDLSGYDTDASDDFSGNYNDLTNRPTIPTVPTNLSGFTNDVGFITNPNDADASTTNEIQDLRFNSGVISLTGDPTTTNIDLSDYDTDASDDFSGNYNDLTNRPTIPTVPTNLSGFTNDVGFITNPNDADASTTNELQTLTRIGTAISLSGVSGSVSIADNDNSTTNEIQNISTTGAAGNISLSSGATLNLNVDDGDADDSNEFQTINRSGLNVTLSNSGGSFSVADNDNSSSNEYNTGMSISGTTIRVTDGGGTRSVNIGGTFATDSELNSRTFDPSAFKATIKTGTIPVGLTTLIFDNEAYDIDGSFDAGIYSVPADGLYNFGGLMLFQQVPTGLVQIIIRDAIGTVLYTKAFAPNSIQSSIGFSVDLQLPAGDKISISLTNTTAGDNTATPFQLAASPDVTNFFFCGKRFN